MGIQSNQHTHACIHNIKSLETCTLTRGTHTHHSQSLGDFIEHKLSSESREEQPPEQRNRSVQHQLTQNVRTKPSRKKRKFGFLPQPSKKRKLGTGNRYTLPSKSQDESLTSGNGSNWPTSAIPAVDLGDVPQIESRLPFVESRSGGHRLVAPC
jgi:hypothetical protein